MIGKTFILIGAVSISGCSLFQATTKPSDITLAKAMQDVGTGMKLMQMAQGDLKTGLIAADVTVVFNVGASDKKTGNLTIDLSSPINSGTGTAGVGGGLTSESASQRGNTVTVRFVNLLTIPKDTLAYKGNLADLLPFVSEQPSAEKPGNAPSVARPKGPIITPYSGKIDRKTLSDIELKSLDGLPDPSQ